METFSIHSGLNQFHTSARSSLNIGSQFGLLHLSADRASCELALDYHSIGIVCPVVGSKQGEKKKLQADVCICSSNLLSEQPA